MANSTCPKCSSNRFEIKTYIPQESRYKLSFVQCSVCGCVIGVMDFYNIGAGINEIEKKLNEISLQLGNLNNLNNVNNNLSVVNNNILKVKEMLDAK